MLCFIESELLIQWDLSEYVSVVVVTHKSLYVFVYKIATRLSYVKVILIRYVGVKRRDKDSVEQIAIILSYV